LTGSPIHEEWNRAEGKAKRLGARLIAVVVEGQRARTYISPAVDQQLAAASAQPAWEPEGELFEKALGFRVPAYGLRRWADLFTRRQLVALTTFSDLVREARERVLADAGASDLPQDSTPLHQSGIGTSAYADTVATYLALCVDKMTDTNTCLCSWQVDPPRLRATFSRQALPMIWDYAEANIFGDAAGDFGRCIRSLTEVLDRHFPCTPGSVHQADATKNHFPEMRNFSTDPPYYDNIGYADLSDFFYVWLKHSLSDLWPELFRRLATPKSEELVATPYRRGGTTEAEAFFMKGMGDALTAMSKAASDGEPLAIYYAFKQSELAEEGIVSAGWASFLQAVVNAGLMVDGTWPMRTEWATRMRGLASNALASSIVLVCRKRSDAAPVVTRADFLRELKREMPEAVDKIRKAGVGPVDMPQSVIGPGMGVFTRYARVLEDDDSSMSVKTALALINRTWGEIENELDANFDPETQVALAWFATYGFDAHTSGDLIVLANAKDIPIESLFRSGVFQNLHGKAGLTPRDKLEPGWSPTSDMTPIVWECVQHTARVLRAENGGAEAAAKLVAAMGAKAEDARALAYRLYEIASQKGWAAEALVYNELAEEWTHLEDVTASAASFPSQAEQGILAFAEGA
jgi:putative DNA methylase